MNQASSTTTITPPIAAECFSRRLRASADSSSVTATTSSSGGVGPADVTISSTRLSGKAFGVEPFPLTGAVNAADAVGAAGVVCAVAAVGAVGATALDSGVASDVVGAGSVLSGASRKMDAARNSDVARTCDLVPPIDSSALANSRPRRNLSTGSFESARAKIASNSVRSGRISLGRGGRSLSCLLTTTDGLKCANGGAPVSK